MFNFIIYFFMSDSQKRNGFGLVLKIIIAVASAIAGALGYSVMS